MKYTSSDSTKGSITVHPHYGTDARSLSSLCLDLVFDDPTMKSDETGYIGRKVEDQILSKIVACIW